MKHRLLILVAAFFLAALCLAAPVLATEGAAWRVLEPGLALRHLPVDEDAAVLHILRIDPARFEPVLLNATAPGEGELHTARGWAEKHGLAAAVNASMYQEDHRTSVSLMRTRDHVNNAYVSKDNTVLAFDPVDSTAAPVAIIDRTCEDFDAERARYGTLIQGIRMVSCRGNNVWEQQKRRHATAAFGIDVSGNLLFIFCEKPLSTHDLIEVLLAAPIDLERCMYAEGGIEAQLYVGAGGVEEEYTGGLIGGLRLGDAFPVPNVVGIRAR